MIDLPEKEPEFWTILKTPYTRVRLDDTMTSHRFYGDGTTRSFTVPANSIITAVYMDGVNITEGDMYVTFNSVIEFDEPVSDYVEITLLAQHKGV